MDTATENNKKQSTTESKLKPSDTICVFGESSTIHGVSKIISPQIFGCRRYLWTILVVGMIIGLAVTLYKSINKYASYPMFTNINVKFGMGSSALPDITICNANQFHRDRIPNDTIIKSLLYQISEFSSLTPTSNSYTEGSLSNPTNYTGYYMHNFAMYASHRLNDMFVTCMWQGTMVDCSEYIETVVTDLGVCYRLTANMDSDMALPISDAAGDSTNILRLILNIEQEKYFFSATSHAGIKVLLHEQQSEPLLLNRGFYVKPGTSTTVEINISENKWLSKPYLAFGTQYCEDIDKKIAYGKNNSYIYTKISCSTKCYRRYLFRKCRCRYFFDPGTAPYCSLEQLQNCLLPLKANLSSTILSRCHCPSPCHAFRYTPMLSVADFASTFIKEYMMHINLIKSVDIIDNNMIDLRIHYEANYVTVIEQKPEITVENIFGSLGGQMGLFIGASFISLVELVEFVCLLICGWWNNKYKKTITHRDNDDNNAYESRV